MTKIGNIEFKNPFLLAPLAGITDAPFRRLCAEQGAALTYTEMVSAKGLWYKDKNTEALLRLHPAEGPTAFQLFGSEPEIMAFALRHLSACDNVLFDVNMGCPVPKVVKNGEGSALMQRPELVYDMICAMVKAAQESAAEAGREPKPVTVKMRIGWDETHINAAEVAKACEAAGAAAVAVHGRTREQYYSGKADWTRIAEVRHAVSIPVIGNGDVFCGTDALRMLDETGCDFVMIARGALGNPWIFAEALALWQSSSAPWTPPTGEARIAMLLRHFDELMAWKGEYAAVREIRKFVGWYLKGMHGAASLRRRVCDINTAAEMRRALMDYFMNLRGSI